MVSFLLYVGVAAVIFCCFALVLHFKEEKSSGCGCSGQSCGSAPSCKNYSK